MTNGKWRQFTSLGLLVVILAAGALSGCTSMGSAQPGAQTRVYVANITQNNVLVFIIDDIVSGSLRSLPPIAVNCNGPQAFVKAPSRKFAHVMCGRSNQFVGFAIDQATNGLTPAGTFNHR
jgi:hypothetical protein